MYEAAVEWRLFSMAPGQVERLKVIFEEQQQALDDDVSEVSHFCITLECILRHQQKGQPRLVG